MPNLRPVPKPSEPIKEKEKGKEKEEIKNAKKLENVEVSAKGTITSGTWVAELDNANIRKSSLRVK